jgi:PAS domain S-box-containing protein
MGKLSASEAAAKLAQLQESGKALLPQRIAAIGTLWQQVQKEGWSNAHANQLHCLAHSLAGSAGTFGARGIGNAARELELTLTPLARQESSPDDTVLQTLDQIIIKLENSSADTPPAVPDSAQPSPRERKEGDLIYIVEDDAPLAEVLATHLKEAGYRTEIFTELTAFTNTMTRPIRPAAILMDMVFPDGCSAGANILQVVQERYPLNVPIIFISVRDDIESRLKALRAGATRYLTKPIDHDKLLRILDELTLRTPPEPYRVLLIDDDEMLVEYYATLLRGEGLNTQTLTDPLQALDLAISFDPEVIITDVNMPGCSGLELAAILREKERFTEVPILFLSTVTNLEQQLSALALGGDDFLTKPIDPKDLITAAITRARRSRRLRQLNHDLRRAMQDVRYQQYAMDQHAFVCITDPAGFITHVNNNFCQASGYSRHELLGQKPSILKSGRHPSSLYDEMWNTISRGRVWHGQLFNRSKKGNGYWMEYSITPFLDSSGAPYQYVAIGTDITHLKQAQTALRENEERTHLSQKFAGIGTWDWDMEHNEVHWSETACPLFGLSARARITPFEQAFKAVHEEDRLHIKEAIDTCIRSYTDFDMEYRIIWQDGSQHWLRATGGMSRREDGTPIHMLGVIRDITMRKRAEEELVAAKESAEKASHAKSEFLSHVTHELRTPLNAILGFTQLLEADEETTPRQQEALREIHNSGRHLLALITKILELTRIEAGDIELMLTPVPCRDLVQECLDLIKPLADQKDIQLKFTDTQDQDAQVTADSTRLRQALLNLLSNAVKYSEKGGQVQVALEPANNSRLRILVTDSGPGIPPEQHPKLFQPFSPLTSTYCKEEGMGIGLVISKELASLMGGHLGFESTVGKGSTFWIELALTNTISAKAPPPV